jgi:cation:H+ antiporter
MALGNAIGSNVFNILMVLGIASAISPIAFIRENIIDIAILLAFTLIVWLFAATKQQLSRKEGFLMLVLYAAYAVYIILR